jgi:hypothetical protein
MAPLFVITHWIENTFHFLSLAQKHKEWPWFCTTEVTLSFLIVSCVLCLALLWCPAFTCRALAFRVSCIASLRRALPGLASRCVALSCPAMPCLSVRCLAFSSIALLCLALVSLAWFCFAVFCFALPCLVRLSLALFCFALPCHFIALPCLVSLCLVHPNPYPYPNPDPNPNPIPNPSFDCYSPD